MTGTERILFAFAVAASMAAAAWWCVVAAFRPPHPRRAAASRPRTPVAPATVGAALAAAVVVAVTRWVVAALAAAALVAVWSSLFQSAATAERRRVAAIAKWLRDLQRGSNLDLPQALDRAALRAPKDIDNEHPPGSWTGSVTTHRSIGRCWSWRPISITRPPTWRSRRCCSPTGTPRVRRCMTRSRSWRPRPAMS